jgi:ferric-dicitrate binding protein FerR (iron transport regulator)
VEILNKAYDAHIIIGKKEYDNLPISTRFRHGEALEKILEVIVATFDIALVREGQTIILN